MKNYLRRFLIIAIVSLTLFRCSDDDPAESFLIEATPLLTRTAGDLQFFLRTASIDVDPTLLRFDVDIFKVRYKTVYKNEAVTASGLVILPRTTESVGMLSFQHGTITQYEDAPTTLPLSSTELILYAALGSSGFIGVVPDYIGFGESKSIFHPYYVEEVTASAVIDNLKAARELAAQRHVSFNQKLFLAGYSQGGYTTMATHKAIEENGLSGFSLVASFPASGGYWVKRMQEYFFGQETYDQPHYIAYVALAYQSYYEWNNNAVADFFNEPYAARIPNLFNGLNSPGTINAQLTNSIPSLLRPDPLLRIDTDARYAYLVSAFNENSLIDWIPKAKMYLYHGDADTTVPYQNSVDTYNNLIAAGASTDVVKFKTLPGADHGSGIIPYVEDFVPVLISLK